MTYQILHVDGSREDFTPTGERPSLEELQKIVGGMIELVRVKGGQLWVNEEGLLLSLPLNLQASRIANGYIVGPALLCLRKVRERVGTR